MATSQSGANRAKAQAIVNMRGEIIGHHFWVTEAAAIRRLRRHLASLGRRLVKSRPGAQQDRLGEFAIVDSSGAVIMASIKLDEQLRAHGLMRPDECMAPQVHKGWRFFGAIEMRVGGCRYLHKVTREYTTEEKLRQVFASQHTPSAKVICGHDAR